MKFKLSKETAVAWIESTVDEIKHLLEKESIPYEDSWTRNEFNLALFHLHQLRFPWADGDVVVGTLHCEDDLVINGEADIHYPSIETYRFPWDEGDITVFDTPEGFVETLKPYYLEVSA